MPPHLRTCLLALLSALLLILSCAAAAVAQDEDAGSSEDPVRIFDRGQDAHAKGDLRRALELYDAALKLRPEFAEAEFQKGVALASLKRLPEAEAALRRAAELKKDWPLPQSALGLLLLRAGREREAETYLRRAAELDPKDTQALAALASLRQRAGATTEALRLIKQATAHEDADASHWVWRARIERAAGDKAATTSVARAFQLDSHSFEAFVERAEQRAASGDLKGAGEDFQAALAVAPEHERAQISRRREEIEAAGKVNDCNEAAVPALEELLRRDPGNASAHACLGAAARKLDPAKSLEHYRAAAELDSKSVKYATGYAAALVQLRRFAEAAIVLRRVLAVAPDDYAAHANLAAALDELKQYNEAIGEFKWLQQARPDLAVVYFFIARDYDLLGQYQLALESYEAFLARADPQQNQLEIEKVNLRLPLVRDLVKRGVKLKKH